MSAVVRDEAPGVHGAVVLDKPSGPTSFKAMRMAQRALGQRTAGHGGTLDPMASGVLVVLLGEATKLSALVMDHTKTYEAEVRLGVGTDTLDAEGAVVAEGPVPELTRDKIEAALAPHVGEVMQVPPRYSALKVEGRTHMSRARAGEEFEVAPRKALCLGLELVAFAGDRLTLRVECGKGYYVRSLARDLGAAFGTPSHLSALRRTRVGAFSLAQAVAPDAPPEVIAGALIPIARMLPSVPRVRVAGKTLEALRSGRWIDASAPLDGIGLALDPEDAPVALVTALGDGTPRLKVVRGFAMGSR